MGIKCMSLGKGDGALAVFPRCYWQLGLMSPHEQHLLNHATNGGTGPGSRLVKPVVQKLEFGMAFGGHEVKWFEYV